uniref:Flavodoxin-like fold domain-containing protein n=1 Tax=Dicentrarchus labrax TaxID=13489 RepID=A0A8C4ITV7_DICLA
LAAKKVFLVYAHQSSGSFNAGCTVEVSDLYAMKFKATATAEDIIGEVKNCDHFCYAEETKLSWEAGRLSADITEEQRKLTETDLVIFQFPMYWFTVPAIMKALSKHILSYLSHLLKYPGSDPSDLLGLLGEMPLSFTLTTLTGRRLSS